MHQHGSETILASPLRFSEGIGTSSRIAPESAQKIEGYLRPGSAIILAMHFKGCYSIRVFSELEAARVTSGPPRFPLGPQTNGAISSVVERFCICELSSLGPVRLKTAIEQLQGSVQRHPMRCDISEGVRRYGQH